MPTAKEIEEKLMSDWSKIPDTLILSSKRKGGTELIRWWKRILPRNHHTPLLQVTEEDVGKLNHFVALVGHDEAYATMKWAIENWNQVFLDVRIQKAENTSATPTIGALLKHASVVVKSMAESSNKGKVQLIATDKTKTTVKVLTKKEMKELLR